MTYFFSTSSGLITWDRQTEKNYYIIHIKNLEIILMRKDYKPYKKFMKNEHTGAKF